MGSRLILAVDPGKMTGYFWYTPDESVPIGGGQLEHFCFLEWFDRLRPSVPVTVVCESFHITQRTIKLVQAEQRMWSVEQIGVIRWLCRRREWDYNEQPPSEAKTFATDDKLKRVEWWLPGKHCRDAARHALLWAVNQRHIDPARLLAAD